VATAAVVLVAFGPGVVALLVAVAPAPPGGESAIAADVHVHAQSIAAEPDIRIYRGPNGNHYVTASPFPGPPAVGIALVSACAVVFVCAAAGYLYRRATAPAGRA
jgi:hypothetical protein